MGGNKQGKEGVWGKKGGGAELSRKRAKGCSLKASVQCCTDADAQKGAGGDKASQMGFGGGHCTKESDLLCTGVYDGILSAAVRHATLVPSPPWLARKRRRRLVAKGQSASGWLEIKWLKPGQRDP